MSYFEDQLDEWYEQGCQGDPIDIDPYESAIDRFENEISEDIDRAMEEVWMNPNDKNTQE